VFKNSVRFDVATLALISRVSFLSQCMAILNIYLICAAVWLLCLGVFYVIAALVGIIKHLPDILFYTLLLPVLPFYVAYKNKKERPTASKILYIVWGAVYAVSTFAILMYYCC